MTHSLKVMPGVFRRIKRGQRQHDCQQDRGFSEGDRVHYREWDPAEDDYSGDEVMCKIKDLTRGPEGAVPRGTVVFTIALASMPTHVRGDVEEQRRRRDAMGAEDL